MALAGCDGEGSIPESLHHLSPKCPQNSSGGLVVESGQGVWVWQEESEIGVEFPGAIVRSNT